MRRRMTWARAYRIAAIAMGREYVRGGRNGYWRWKANDDPLAHHLLAELIMGDVSLAEPSN